MLLQNKNTVILVDKFSPLVENQTAALTDGGDWLADYMMEHLQRRKNMQMVMEMIKGKKK